MSTHEDRDYDFEPLPGLPAPLPDGEWCEWSLELEAGVDPGEVLEHCSSQGIALRKWDHHQASLHDVFVQLVGEEDIEP